MTAKEVLAFAERRGARMVDFKFCDLFGSWQHISMPLAKLRAESFEEGFGFDGSSIRGWQPIQASDMLFVPDPGTAKIDPFFEVVTLSLTCNVADPITREPYSRDPRYVAAKAEAYLRSSGVADQAHFGPEPEFFVFDEVRFDEGPNRAFYQLDSREGRWNSGRPENPNLGYKPDYKRGYFPVSPTDSLANLRAEMVQTLEDLGIPTEAHHHEVASGGQGEIEMRHAPLREMADQIMWFKYVVKNVAARRAHTATFMPKPIFGDNGSGMHTHQSLWKDGRPLFAGNRYGGLSETGLHYVGGLLRHAPALCAFICPTTNSYKRLVPGFEAPVNLAYSSRNRSAAVRIPMISAAPAARRLEFRTPDPSCNPYLALAAMLMAGLDGVQNRIDPGEPVDKDIYGLAPEELRDIPQVPFTLEAALEALRADHAFLLRGDVFTPDLIDTWVRWKTANETAPVAQRPHPYEFALYYDC